jgi:hypothetical protein
MVRGDTPAFSASPFWVQPRACRAARIRFMTDEPAPRVKNHRVALWPVSRPGKVPAAVPQGAPVL